MPANQISLFLLSHAKTTERADGHSFKLMSKMEEIHGLNMNATKSHDEAKRCLVNMIALVRDYTDPSSNRRTPITQCEKMRAAGTWMINGV
jgi:hypothetical protein